MSDLRSGGLWSFIIRSPQPRKDGTVHTGMAISAAFAQERASAPQRRVGPRQEASRAVADLKTALELSKRSYEERLFLLHFGRENNDKYRNRLIQPTTERR